MQSPRAHLPFLVLALAATPALAQLSQLPFPNPEFATGELPTGVAVGDLDGDGHPDVVVAAAGDFDFLGFHQGTTIAVHLGADGILAAPFHVPVGTGPVDVIVADLDGDGDLDVATADAESDSVTILLNDGSGTGFASSSAFAGPDPFDMDAGDIDGDGDVDLAVASLGPSFSPEQTVALVINDGAGGFSFGASVMVGTRPAAVDLHDLDGDGDLDLTAGNFDSDDVSVLLNEGTGVFLPAPSLPVSTGFNEGPTGIEAGDLDGDGHVDLAVSNGAFPAAGFVALFPGNGDGTFGPAKILFAGTNVDDVALADLDDDGELDIVAVNKFSSDVSVFLNDGGGFPAEAPRYPLNTAPNRVALADLDGDGAEEIVAVCESVDHVAVLRGVGDGTFGSDEVLPVTGGQRSIGMADFDGDGRDDLLVAVPADSFLVFRREADGGFADPLEVAVAVDSPVQSQPGDFDGDGDVDVATLGGDGISVRFNGGAGTFPFEGVTPHDDLRVTSLAAGDVDGDGDIDLALIAALPRDVVRIFLNQGAGTFAESEAFVYDPGGKSAFFGDFFTRSALVDLDGDGAPDLVLVPSDGGVGFPGNRLIVFPGIGDGTLGEQRDFPLPPGSRGMTLADVDRDGHLDVATAIPGGTTFEGDPTGTNVAIVRGLPDGTFGPFQEIAVGGGPRAVGVADVDHDGVTDLLVGTGRNHVSFLRGDGLGGFVPSGLFGIGSRSFELIARDLDVDGAIDLVVAHEGTAPSVLMGQPQDGTVVPYGSGVNPAGSIQVLSGEPAIGTTLTLGLDNPLGTQAAGSRPVLAVSLAADPAFPCGILVPGLGMAGPGAGGEQLVSIAPEDLVAFLLGPPWSGPGQPAPIDVPIPALPGLVGAVVFVQGAIVDPTAATGVGTGLTDALLMRLGP